MAKTSCQKADRVAVQLVTLFRKIAKDRITPNKPFPRHFINRLQTSPLTSSGSHGYPKFCGGDRGHASRASLFRRANDTRRQSSPHRETEETHSLVRPLLSKCQESRQLSIMSCHDFLDLSLKFLSEKPRTKQYPWTEMNVPVAWPVGFTRGLLPHSYDRSQPVRCMSAITLPLNDPFPLLPSVLCYCPSFQ